MSLEFKRIVSLRLSVFILKQNIPHFFSTVDINHYRDYTKRKTYLLESNIIQLEKNGSCGICEINENRLS